MEWKEENRTGESEGVKMKERGEEIFYCLLDCSVDPG